MKHHTSILIFLISFVVLFAFVSKPKTDVYAAKVQTEKITQAEIQQVQQNVGIVIPATVATTITTKQDLVSYLIVTLGAFLTTLVMALLKFLMPKVFGNVK